MTTKWLSETEALQAVEMRKLPNGKTLVVQPVNSMICGQCAMAMVTGADVADMVRKTKLHPNGGTTSRARDVVLAEYAAKVYTTYAIDNRKRLDLSGKGILAIQFGRSNSGHALAFEDGEIYDPAGRYYENIAAMRRCYKERGRKIRVFAITYVTPHEQQELMAAND